MKRILITGASGFIGMPIVRELADSGDYEIYAVSSGRREVTFPEGVNAVSANLLDRVQSKRLIEDVRPEIMLHLAWELSKPDFLTSKENLVWFEESMSMLCAFIESGGKYFAFAGSSSEYGSFRGFSEEGGAPAHALYGLCKNAFHKTAQATCSLGKKDLRDAARGFPDVSYVNLRIFSVIGKGMSTRVATAAAAAAFAAGERFTCKSPYNIWDFVCVDDVARAVRAVLAKQYTGAVNIGSGMPRMMGDVFKTIAQKMAAVHLLTIDYDNKNKDILVANTDVLENIIGYTCRGDFDKALDDMIDDVRGRNR